MIVDHWYLVTDAATFSKTKLTAPNLRATGLNQVQNETFCDFLEFGSSLKLHLVEVKPTKKIWGLKFGPNELKSGLKLGFCYFRKFGSLVFLYIAYDDSLEQCLTTSRGETYEKNCWGGGDWAHFVKFAWLVFFDIAQNCSLGQFLTSSKVETSKKVLWPKLKVSQMSSGIQSNFQNLSNVGFLNHAKILISSKLCVEWLRRFCFRKSP